MDNDIIAFVRSLSEKQQDRIIDLFGKIKRGEISTDQRVEFFPENVDTGDPVWDSITNDWRKNINQSFTNAFKAGVDDDEREALFNNMDRLFEKMRRHQGRTPRNTGNTS